MKKLVLLFILLAGFTSVHAQRTNDGWEDWQKTNCYAKVAFRLKYAGKNGTQHHWQVQFRNDYPEIISFNYHVTDKLQEHDITTHRKTLFAGKTSDITDVYTTEEDIYLLVDKLSFSPYPENFSDCDN